MQPAAAVMRRVQALIGITGRKARRFGVLVKLGLNLGTASKTTEQSTVEGGGISCVAVKCVDIGRNTSGEGDHLDRY